MRSTYDDNSRTKDRPTSRGDSDYDRGMFGWNDDEDRRRSRSRNSSSDRSNDFRSHRSDDRDHGDRVGRDPEYGPDGYREGMPRDETERLIASSKVEGTPVYDRDGNKLGSICTLMINKRSGQTEYAVLKYNSDFLGLKVNEHYYPLDWRELTYDRRIHGYGVDFTKEQLENRAGYDSDGRRVRSRNHGNHQPRSAAWS